jgi:PAS domain-containing protein
MKRSGWIRLNEQGAYLDADEGALSILGVTLDQLRESQPGAFPAQPLDPVAAEAFRAAWELGDRQTLAGSTTIRRPDGQNVPITFLIEPQPDTTLLAVIKSDFGAPSRPTAIYTVAEVLRAWRDAERRLQEVLSDTPEWIELQARVAELREEYQRAVSRSVTPP